MANIYRNIFARGIKGAFGEQSVAHTTYSGKTILTNEPLLDDRRKYLEALKVHQAAILEASTYANFAKSEVLYLQKELETGMSAYYLAVADWFSSPRILQINVDNWTGKAGETIRIKARDNVGVTRIAVVIRDVEGNVLEMGEATQSEAGSPWWRYTTCRAVALTPFPNIQAIAEDLPGNSTSFTIS